MAEIMIRKATMEDFESLRVFEQAVISAERPFDQTLKASSTNYYDIPELINADHIELLVGEIDGSLIASGYARIEFAKPYLQHIHHAYLGFMYVLPEYRGKGVNKMIIDGLTSWAKSRDILELRLDVYHLNESAIKAYEKVGFAKHMVEMRKGL